MGKSFDESKVRRNNDGTFADKDKHHAPTDLPAADNDHTPVGEEFIDNANRTGTTCPSEAATGSTISATT